MVRLVYKTRQKNHFVHSSRRDFGEYDFGTQWSLVSVRIQDSRLVEARALNRVFFKPAMVA